ncbi:RORB-like protein [Mya arenaria]|uniref:RORB-like protein n=1 Tax=Mya arenaria TaxID=6604 RepID=A0ABY7DXF4_MYAAR|nr:RORB-like protein [Mya arenaria]
MLGDREVNNPYWQNRHSNFTWDQLSRDWKLSTQDAIELRKKRAVDAKMFDQTMEEYVPNIGEEVEMTTTSKKRKRSTRGGGGNSPYTTIPLPPCKVCGGTATGYHFGVITCEACKAFFRRALIHQHDYKCLKDDNCVITDKKLGNCSACRLRKCFHLGMSKGGVRRGRYSIAIRTQAIMEAKARESSDVMETELKRQRLDDTTVEEVSSLEGGGFTFDVFDGLLDISQLSDSAAFPMSESPTNTSYFDETSAISPEYVSRDDTLSMSSSSNGSPLISPTIYVEESPSYTENQELELLIDAIMSCQEAVYPTLKRQYTTAMQQEQMKIYMEFNEKNAMFGDLLNGTVSTEEFQQIFAETGLDLDDRLSMFNKKGNSMEDTIAQYVNFAKLVPGFKTINPKDVAKLLKSAHFEFWMVGNYMLFNSKLGVTTSWDGSHKANKEDCMKFFEKDIIDAQFELADKLKTLNLSLEEIALIRLIILTYTDRCPLVDAGKISALQEKFVECLQYQLSKTQTNPGRRMFRIFDHLLAMRDVTYLNIKANQKFLKEWDFVMHDYPLWREMLSYDGES